MKFQNPNSNIQSILKSRQWHFVGQHIVVDLLKYMSSIDI